MKKVLILLLLIANSQANDNEFLIDYFVYKDVSSVVGLSCKDTESNKIIRRKWKM